LQRRCFHAQVNIGTKVIVQPMDRRADNMGGKRSWLAGAARERNFKTQKWRWFGAIFLFPDMTKL